MIGVEADVVEVVVFAAGADALLGVGGAGLADMEPVLWPRKIGHELVHAGVREQADSASPGSRLEEGTMVCCFSLEEIEETTGGSQSVFIFGQPQNRKPQISQIQRAIPDWEGDIGSPSAAHRG